MLNFPRDHFAIKTESVFALGQFEIGSELLFFISDEIGFIKNLGENGRLDIVLVDHNQPVEIMTEFADKITMVIDHHKLVTPSILPEKVKVENSKKFKKVFFENFDYFF